MNSSFYPTKWQDINKCLHGNWFTERLCFKWNVYIYFFMSFVGDGSIVSTFFAVITTGDNASKTGKILWVGNSAENYVSLTDGVTLHLHITSSIWMQCALAKV